MHNKIRWQMLHRVAAASAPGASGRHAVRVDALLNEAETTDLARLQTADPDATLDLLVCARAMFVRGQVIDSVDQALRARLRSVLAGGAWEACFPLPWTRDVRSPLSATASGFDLPACPDAHCQTLFEYPGQSFVLFRGPGLSGSATAETVAVAVARALVYYCAGGYRAQGLPDWLAQGFCARLDLVLQGRDWEAAFPLPSRAAALPGSFRTELPTMLLGLERWALQTGTRHSPALRAKEAIARLATYRSIGFSTIRGAYTRVKALRISGPDDPNICFWPEWYTLYPIARLTAVLICRGVRQGLSHARRRERILAGEPRRAWRDRGAPPARPAATFDPPA